MVTVVSRSSHLHFSQTSKYEVYAPSQQAIRDPIERIVIDDKNHHDSSSHEESPQPLDILLFLNRSDTQHTIHFTSYDSKDNLSLGSFFSLFLSNHYAARKLKSE